MSMVGRLRLIFWGMFFAFLDFKLNDVNLLPDVIGYLLLIIGCGGLARESSRFIGAQGLCAVLAVLSLWPDWYLEKVVVWIGHGATLLSVLLMWMLLGGIMDFTEARQGTELARRASRLRRAYVALSLLFWVFIHLAGAPANGFLWVLVAMLVICALGAMLLILKLIGRVRYELAANPDENVRTHGSGATVGLTGIVLAALLVAGWVRMNSGYRSQTTSGANFHARSVEENTRTEENLLTMLREKGFTQDYHPDGMDRFAGLHTAEERERWLASTREEFKGIYLHLQMEKTAIRVSVKWEHTGFIRDVDRRHRKALELLLELARWFGQRAEKDDAADVMQDSGIRSLEEALARVPGDE
ncbi:MAG: hypothetical protein V4819_16480 [Verrucomicrobiota bacterium]